jgi:hypothetical protein
MHGFERGAQAKRGLASARELFVSSTMQGELEELHARL